MTIIEATAVAVTGLMVGGTGIVLGQVELPGLPPSTPSWLNATGGVISLCFTAWYAWYVTTHTIPGMVKEFRDEVKEQRQAARADVNKIGESMDRLSCVIEKAIK
jgi:hypothetical protein